MTPSELNALLSEGCFQPSLLAYITGIERSRIVKYLGGALHEITSDEMALMRSKLDFRDVTQVDEHLSAAIRPFIKRSSVLYIFEDKGDLKSASGTLVKLGERVFVATTRHTIPKYGTSILEIIGGNRVEYIQKPRDGNGKGLYKGETEVAIRRHGRHECLDVGYLEIEPDCLSVLDRFPVALDGLNTGGVIFGKAVVVFGFPSDYQHIQQFTHDSGEHWCASLMYRGPALAPEEWPSTAGDESPTDSNIDCILRYEKNDPRVTAVVASGETRRHASHFPAGVPTPFGMSGGGYWQSAMKFDSGDVWSPSDYKLIAIQGSWSPTKNYIRGIRISKWLELIAKDYPDLRPIISGGRGPDEP